MEAELIAGRLFRFRARRSIGVFYSLGSILPLLGIILSISPVTRPFIIPGVIAGLLLVWSVARLSGFRGFSKMQYSLDFLEGKRGSTYDDKKTPWLSWKRGFALFIASCWPWFGYIITDQGHSFVAGIFLAIFVVELVLIRALSRSKKDNSIVERRGEDWAVIAGVVIVAFAALLPGAAGWTWALASPVFLLTGIKSLYDAPKELAMVAF